MTGKLLVIAAGGTGGHMFPAQALAEVMLGRGWRVKLSTDPRGARYTGGFPEATQIEQVASSTFARGGLRAKLMVPFQILKGVLTARRDMRRDPPTVVVGFGGYPAIPATTAAWLLKLPRMIHEQNGVLGRVNQLFVKRVNAVACGTWPTDLPDGVNGIHIGNPVRAKILERAGAQYIQPGAYPMKVVVMGGSQGARILSQVVPDALAMLQDDLRSYISVIHQARDEDADHVRSTYNAAGIGAEVMPFIHDVPAQFAEAQLVISRAGASSVADIAVIGRPSILVPLAAAIRDEQTANAQGLARSGAAIILQESEFTAKKLMETLSTLLANPEKAAEMSRAALDAAKPDAAEDLADLVESLAEKGPVQ